MNVSRIMAVLGFVAATVALGSYLSGYGEEFAGGLLVGYCAMSAAIDGWRLLNR